MSTWTNEVEKNLTPWKRHKKDKAVEIEGAKTATDNEEKDSASNPSCNIAEKDDVVP